MTIADLLPHLETFAPLALAEAWDNVGLLLGDAAAPVTKVMTCLTVTPESAAEAIKEKAELIVSHHPVLFRPVQRVTTDTPEGATLWKLARAGVAIYSPHTAFDSAASGINQRIAIKVGCTDIAPLHPLETDATLGAGRLGALPPQTMLADLAEKLADFLKLESIGMVGPRHQVAERVAFACGSGGSFVGAAAQAGSDVLVTGEATFHDCLAAHARGLGLILVGHFASERFAVAELADELAAVFPMLTVYASRTEQDPVKRISC
jgi:GTP cyclohydrolase I